MFHVKQRNSNFKTMLGVSRETVYCKSPPQFINFSLKSMDTLPEIKTLFPQLTDEQFDALLHFSDLIFNYNQRLNLVSRADIHNLWNHHILPSMIVDRLVGIPIAAAVIDLGSGGGFPGIPLKITRPDLQMVLVDSVRKKVLFLKKVIRELSLSNLTALNVRISPKEDPYQLKNCFDIVTARAVTSLQKLLDLTVFLLKPHGYILTWKGEKDLVELENESISRLCEYEIISVPLKYHPYSDKFSNMRLIKLTPIL